MTVTVSSPNTQTRYEYLCKMPHLFITIHSLGASKTLTKTSHLIMTGVKSDSQIYLVKVVTALEPLHLLARNSLCFFYC